MCGGTGVRKVVLKITTNDICPCVWRAVFRVALSHYSRIQYGVQMCTVRRVRRGRQGSWDLPELDYCADFECACVRAASQNRIDEAVVRLYHLSGLPWRQCAERLGIDRGAFFHRAYAMEEKIGRLVALMRPHSLIPFSAYVSA